MAQPTHDKLLKVVFNALNTVSSPDLHVFDGVRLANELAANECELMPLRLSRAPAGGGKQRWTFKVLLVVASRIGSADASRTAWSSMFEATFAAYNAIDPESLQAAIRDAGGEKLLRDDMVFWHVPGAKTGVPTGASCELTLTFTE